MTSKAIGYRLAHQSVWPTDTIDGAFWPPESRALRHFYFKSRQHIFSGPDSSGYGDKRDRNKPFGPGGSTRRLHHELMSRGPLRPPLLGLATDLSRELVMGAN